MKKQAKTMATTHKARVTALMNQHYKEQHAWLQEANKYLKEEADSRFLHAEQLHNLTNKIRTHYPIPDTESDTPIKQEQE